MPPLGSTQSLKRRNDDGESNGRRKRNQTEESEPPRNVILPMKEPYMQQIASGAKTYEFRKYRLPQSIEFIWFYRTAPFSSIEYVCGTLPACSRGNGDPPLVDDGLGNREFNSYHKDWEGYDYAYKITSVYRLQTPLTLKDLREQYDFKGAPRGMMYTPSKLVEHVNLVEEERLI